MKLLIIRKLKLVIAFVGVGFFNHQANSQVDDLWGTSFAGGQNNKGVVFKFETATQNYSVVHDFSQSTGAGPHNSVHYNTENKMVYGTASSGGVNSYGVLYQIDPSTNQYTVKVNFSDYGTKYPNAKLSFVNSKYYGVTQRGDIYSYDPLNDVFAVIISLDPINGDYFESNICLANDKLYLTSKLGGAYNLGVLIEFDPNTNVLRKLLDFKNGLGKNPAGIMQASNGKLYGITTFGGSNNRGVYYSYDLLSDTYEKLGSFSASEASYCNSTFFEASDGKLYALSLNPENIFYLDLSTNEISVVSTGLASQPTGSLIEMDGKLFGTTRLGGSGGGTLFSYELSSQNYSFESNLTNQGVGPHTGGLEKVPSQSCSDPTGVHLISVTENSATLGWSEASPINKYRLRYTEVENEQWQYLDPIGEQITIMGLEEATLYRFQIISYCTSALTSGPMGNNNFNFVTAGAVPCVNQNISSWTSTANSVDFDWNYDEYKDYYRVRYMPIGGANWTYLPNIYGYSGSISGLAPSTDYRIQSRGFCSQNASSWVQKIVSTQSSSKIGLNSQSVSNFTIFPNPSAAEFNISSDILMDKVVVTDLFGNEVDSWSGVYKVKIGAELSLGIYVVRVFQGGVEMIDRIVKH